jgi:hypothetical protein
MEKHAGDIELQFAACSALTNMTTGTPLNQAAAGRRGIVAVVAAMQASSHAHARMQVAGCNALTWLVLGNAANQEHACGTAAMQAVLGAMANHHADVEMLLAGCNALNVLVRSHADAARKAASAGAICTLVAVLRAHFRHAGLCVTACAAVGNVTAPLDANQKKRAIGAGAVEALLAVLHALPADAKVQYSACNTLGNLFLSHNKLVATPLAARAIGAVVAAMKAHPTELEVQRDACYAIWAMTTSSPNKAAAGTSGAVRAVLAALEAHRTEAEIRMYGCRALCSLSYGNSQNVADARAAGAIDAVCALMRAGSGAPEAGASQGSGGHGGGACDDDSVPCVLTLHVLTHGHDDAAARAARADADVEALVARQTLHGREEEAAHAQLVPQLRDAAQRHDAGRCTEHATCQRCAALRASGAMCALPGCCARKRAEGGKKKLLRCGTCLGACYCGAAHQREDWERHKTDCATQRGGANSAAKAATE